jgi:hypothetical protein
MFAGDFSSLPHSLRKDVWQESAKSIKSICGETTHFVFWEKDDRRIISNIRIDEQLCYFELP